MPIVIPTVPHPTTTAHRDLHPPSPGMTPGMPAPIDAPTGIAGEDPLTAGSVGFGSGVSSIGVAEGPPSGELWRTEPPPAPPQPPIHWHSGIRVPQKIVDLAPVYPRFARDAHAQGIVIIKATIDARGNVVAARVIKSVSLLDQAALDAVRQWKFSPTLLNGVPVPIIMTVTVRFTLQ